MATLRALQRSVRRTYFQLKNSTQEESASLQTQVNSKSEITHNHNLNSLAEKEYSSLSGKPTIPTALSQLTDDSTHRTVTDSEKGTWYDVLNKSDISHNHALNNLSEKSYDSLTDKPTIPAIYQTTTPSFAPNNSIFVTHPSDTNYKRMVSATHYHQSISNLYAYWKLNENIGTIVYDSSGNARNGNTIHNPLWQPGKLNSCLKLYRAVPTDPRTDYVDCGNIAGFERSDSFSTHLWFNTTDGPGTVVLIGKQNSVAPYRGWIVFMANGGKVYFQLCNTYWQNCLQIYTPLAYNDGVWHHVVCTYNGNSDFTGMKIYMDGALISTLVSFNTLTATIINSETCQIGARGGNANYYLGYIDDVAIFTKVLPADDVAILYNAGNGQEMKVGATPLTTSQITTEYLSPTQTAITNTTVGYFSSVCANVMI